MKVYRSILLNENEAINTNNIGTSWTLCEIFAEEHAADINNYHQKDGYVILRAEINESNIDFSNTLFAMDNRKNEFEVVLNGGELECEVYRVSGIQSEEEDTYFTGIVGNNTFEDYCHNYDGDLTEKDFIDVALEF